MDMQAKAHRAETWNEFERKQAEQMIQTARRNMLDLGDNGGSYSRSRYEDGRHRIRFGLIVFGLVVIWAIVGADRRSRYEHEQGTTMARSSRSGCASG